MMEQDVCDCEEDDIFKTKIRQRKTFGLSSCLLIFVAIVLFIVGLVTLGFVMYRTETITSKNGMEKDRAGVSDVAKTKRKAVIDPNENKIKVIEETKKKDISIAINQPKQDKITNPTDNESPKVEMKWLNDMLTKYGIKNKVPSADKKVNIIDVTDETSNHCYSFGAIAAIATVSAISTSFIILIMFADDKIKNIDDIKRDESFDDVVIKSQYGKLSDIFEFNWNDWDRRFNDVLEEKVNSAETIYKECEHEYRHTNHNDLFYECLRKIPNSNAWLDDIPNIPSNPKSYFDTSNKTYVILFAYERTGSSFVGQLLSLNEDFVFMYEPLHSHSARPMSFPRELDTPLNATSDLEALILNGMLTCNFYQIPANSLVYADRNYYEIKNARNKVLQDYFDCYISYGKHSPCMSLLKDICQSKKVVSVKTVRGTMEGVAKLISNGMLSLKHTKILHLMRDPRPHFLSRLEEQWTHLYQKPVDKINNITSLMCTRILKDVLIRKKLSQQFPNMFREIVYEHVASHPWSVFTDIYGFIGAQVPGKLKKFVTIMSNSSEAISNLWKTRLNPRVVREIDKRCVALYNEVGYLPIGDGSELLDMTQAIHRDYSMWQ
ncbi:unnamed protein product [Owenia fusiformis]|uniref:Sulfotransferase n=1 Tax=Owenia fusiformis TaxID=6347 RepID=A0A8S4PQM5_OWEFU|nr:unnamed protein product [Owenia fusiformis]